MNRSSRKKANRLRLAMVGKGLTSNDLAAGAEISISFALKLMSDHSRPSRGTIRKIESWLGARIWSSPSEWKQDMDAASAASIVHSIEKVEALNPIQARQEAANRFPDLFPMSPPKKHAQEKIYAQN